MKRLYLACFLIGAGLLLMIFGCAGAKVRYDAAPSPVDNNQHTVLMDIDCGDGATRTGYGQVGCSWSSSPSGRVTVHTPLPGSIAMISRSCGIDQTDFHDDKGGSFQYELAPLFPDGVTSCVIDVFVAWQLPPQMTTEFPLRGMLGKIYLRRRGTSQAATPIEWGNGKTGSGVAWAQFREMGIQEVGEPLTIKLSAAKPVASGSYRLFGCGVGVETTPFSGSTITLTRDQLVGPAPKKSSCLLFGFVVGRTESGELINQDVVIGTEVFGAKVMKLAASITAKDGKVCYSAEDAVSLAVLNYGETNQGSNKVSDCFKLQVVPGGYSNARLGLFTHQGRSLYAIIENGSVKEVLQ